MSSMYLCRIIPARLAAHGVDDACRAADQLEVREALQRADLQDRHETQTLLAPNAGFA